MAKSKGSAGRVILEAGSIGYQSDWIINGDVDMPEVGQQGVFLVTPDGKLLDVSRMAGRNPVHVQGTNLLARRFGWESAGGKGDGTLQEAFDLGYITVRVYRRINGEPVLDITTTMSSPTAWRRIERIRDRLPMTTKMVLGWGANRFWEGPTSGFYQAASFDDLMRY